MAQVPGYWVPSGLEPSMETSWAARAQPPPLTLGVAWVPAGRPRRHRVGRPADSARQMVFDRPSVTSAKRGLSASLGIMPLPDWSANPADTSSGETLVVAP